MIFQIDYLSGGRFDLYFNSNKGICDSLDYKRYTDVEIDSFLREYGYYDLFYSKKVFKPLLYAEKAIKCDLLRLLICYELGGIYVDADVYFTSNIIYLEDNLSKRYGNRNVMLLNRSLYFIRGLRKSRFMNYMVNMYRDADYLHLDVMMNKRHPISKFHDELMIIPNETLDRYFQHKKGNNKI